MEVQSGGRQCTWQVTGLDRQVMFYSHRGRLYITNANDGQRDTLPAPWTDTIIARANLSHPR